MTKDKATASPKDAALKLALEALEEIHVGNMTPMAEINWNKAIAAIKEALAQLEQEPDDLTIAYMTGFHDGKKKREWVGLTDKEAMQICVDCGCMSEDWLTLLDAITAKLKEKNS